MVTSHTCSAFNDRRTLTINPQQTQSTTQPRLLETSKERIENNISQLCWAFVNKFCHKLTFLALYVQLWINKQEDIPVRHVEHYDSCILAPNSSFELSEKMQKRDWNAKKNLSLNVCSCFIQTNRLQKFPHRKSCKQTAIYILCSVR
jgi:hypothetical protein